VATDLGERLIRGKDFLKDKKKDSTETLEGGDRYSVLPKLRSELLCLGERDIVQASV
jgi:hypothetical protein